MESAKVVLKYLVRGKSKTGMEVAVSDNDTL